MYPFGKVKVNKRTKILLFVLMISFIRTMTLLLRVKRANTILNNGTIYGTLLFEKQLRNVLSFLSLLGRDKKRTNSEKENISSSFNKREKATKGIYWYNEGSCKIYNKYK